MKGWIAGLYLVAAVALAGCSAPVVDKSVPQGMGFAETESAEAAKIAALTEVLLALGEGVSPEEAARVAEVAVLEPLQWAQEWNVTDPPLLHNMKVNHGTRPRGLCKDWADDLQVAMWREKLQTIDLHRAIANHTNLRLEHSVLIVSAKGAPMEEGIVLDPWRQGGGRLFFTGVMEDPRYDWVAREEVFAWKREWQARVRAENGS